MEVYKYKYTEAVDLTPSVIALGFFDGVHIAHRDLILSASRIAHEKGMPLGIFTFDGDIKSGVPKIYGQAEKLKIFEQLGADFVVLADFESIKDLTPEEFVCHVLYKDLSARTVVAGFNFRFGKGAVGNAESLAALMKSIGGEAVIRREITSDDGKTVSSTRIRELISKKDIKTANSLLGAPYFIRGRVSSGNKKGRELGFPTVNTSLEPDRTAPLGVFRSAVPIDGKIYHAVTNIGSCPTLGEREIHAETHIINYTGDLYERELEIYLLGFLREEIHFNSVDELCRRVEEDKKRTVNENGELSWQRLGLK